MDRLLIERIEGRILLGITMFVAIMILIGWQAINEPSRMAAFERQHLGRSIERGGILFANNCSTCHGTDGRGIIERAPGLNSPHLFGVNFIAEINGRVANLQRQVNEANALITELNRERDDLFTEIGNNPTAERQAEIVARIGEIDALLDPANGDGPQAAITALEAELEPLLAERDNQIDTLQAAIDRNYLPRYEQVLAQAEAEGNPLLLTNYIADDSSRLLQVGWTGDLRSYLTTTLVHGRPSSGYLWGGNVMAAWSQTAGGPLRADQINDLVNFILNWDKGDRWTLEDLYGVHQFGKIPADASLVSMDAGAETVGANVADIVANLASVTGDPTRGESLYNGAERTEVRQRLACSSCHMGGAQAPATDVTWDTTLNVRLSQPELAGYTVEQYLVESIVRPNDYIVPSYASGVMPQQYASQMSLQDMADILAYLRTYSTQE